MFSFIFPIRRQHSDVGGLRPPSLGFFWGKGGICSYLYTSEKSGDDVIPVMIVYELNYPDSRRKCACVCAHMYLQYYGVSMCNIKFPLFFVG